MRHFGVGALLVLAAAPVAAQKPVELTKPERSLEEPFTQLLTIRELKDGRILTVDFKEKLVQIADFTKGTVQTIGHQGSGPGEYNYPIGLVPLPDGRTWIYDPMNQRFLAVGPDGQIGEMVTFSSLGGLKGFAMMLLPGTDARGRLYFEAITQQSFASKDSTAILRWTKGKATLDTVAWTAPMDFGIERKDGKVRLKAMKMFAPQETWVVDPAGRVARVTPAPFRVVWYDSAGQAAPGPVVPFQPVKVTEAEKDEVRKSIKAALAGAGAAAAKQGITIPEPEFAETKPPFPAKGAAVIGPNGEVWVGRSVGFAERARYDRFDGKGRLIGSVTLNPKSAILGFGTGAVYVARKDDDDLMYLERYRWPVK